jgi:hypothetical protein
MVGTGDWLESLGLGQYRAVFEDNAIDLDTLPHVTDEDRAVLVSSA